MTQELETLRACIAQINPTACDYEEWLAVGMALKDNGGAAHEWEQWSRADPRYKQNECARKWKSFNGGGGARVGVGSIVELCRRNGGTPPKAEFKDEAMGWDDYIGRDSRPKDELKVVNDWTEDVPVIHNIESPVQQLTAYLATLFHSEEIVGYVTDAWLSEKDKEGRQSWMPKRGVYSQTAGELIERLAHALDIGEVVGDCPPEAGAWIRFNPLDGQGVADTNVTAYRFALVESDNIPVERQNAIVRELQLPVAALVHSGGKSLHAIVRIDAPDYAEYQKRVDFLYDVCRRNGMDIDRKNRNPSRLSRMPGVTRKGKVQQLVGTNLGLPSWADWTDWIAAQNDDLPDIECLGDCFHNLPPLAPCLIEGVLRQGHKMRITGPSKAAKSLMIERLAIAIAEGCKWLNWDCAQGRVLYVNCEIDHRSLKHRLHDIYIAAGIQPKNIDKIDMWNLKGRSTPMNDLAPRLIRRALKRRAEGKGYKAIIIDPIYKVLTGDENSAVDMSRFCNQFDKICNELDVAVIDIHHHSKGEQGQKRAGDRGSGSGVFQRDPDALLDLIELDLDKAKRATIHNRIACQKLGALLDVSPESRDWREDCPQDDAIVAPKLLAYAVSVLGPERPSLAMAAANEAGEELTAWRIEPVLREFKRFKPVHLTFTFPLHVVDSDGLLADTKAAGEITPRADSKGKAKRELEQKISDLESAVSFMEAPVKVADIAKKFKVESKTIRNWLADTRKHGIETNLEVEDGIITLAPPSEEGAE